MELICGYYVGPVSHFCELDLFQYTHNILIIIYILLIMKVIGSVQYTWHNVTRTRYQTSTRAGI